MEVQMRTYFRPIHWTGLLVTLLIVLSGCDTSVDESVDLVRYSGDAITAAVATGPGEWQGRYEPESGLVILELVVPTGEVTRRLTLLNVPAPLPDFVNYESNPEGSSRSTLRTGTVWIQDWDLNGVVSGKAEGILQRGAYHTDGRTRFTFWYDFSQE